MSLPTTSPSYTLNPLYHPRLPCHSNFSANNYQSKNTKASVCLFVQSAQNRIFRLPCLNLDLPCSYVFQDTSRCIARIWILTLVWPGRLAAVLRARQNIAAWHPIGMAGFKFGPNCPKSGRRWIFGGQNIPRWDSIGITHSLTRKQQIKRKHYLQGVGKGKKIFFFSEEIN